MTAAITTLRQEAQQQQEGAPATPGAPLDTPTEGVKKLEPTGEMTPEDTAIFDKFFGGEGEVEDPKAKEPAAKAPAKSGKPAPSVDTTTKESAGSKTKDGPEEAATEESVAEAEVSKKARDIFEKAEKTKDLKEARKLYKQAMKAAFGKVPDEFNDARFATARQAEAKRSEDAAKREADIDTKSANLEKNASDWVAKLTPAVSLHKRLIAIRDNGDWPALGQWIADVTEKAPDEALRLFTRGIKEGPETRAARAAQESAKQAEKAANDRIAALERKLEEKDKTKEEQARQERIAAKRASYLENLTTELAEHPVAKLPNGFKRVMAYIIKTADPKLKAPTKSPEQAADFIVASERRRVKAARHLLDEEEAEAPARNEPAHAVARTQTRDSGKAQSFDPDAAFDRAWSKHAPQRRSRR